jgi:hypothetical protein
METNPEKQTVTEVKCETVKYRMNNLCADEVALFDRALHYNPSATLTEMDRASLQKAVRDTSDVDVAAALFYHSVITDTENSKFLDYLEIKEKTVNGNYPDYSSEKVLFLMVPGMFYKDNPEIQASGQSLRQFARKLGLKDDLVNVKQTGTVDENGQIVCDYLKNVDDKEINSIIIASVSKGSGDVKRAIGICGGESYFKKVRGWYNIGGITNGSLLVNGILADFNHRMQARFYFFIKGYSWKGLKSIRHGIDAPLEKPVIIPERLKIVSVIGVPFYRFVTPRAGPYYKYLVQFGPSDGMVLLADAYMPSGKIYPSLRNDHYFSFAFPEERMVAILSYIMESMHN